MACMMLGISGNKKHLQVFFRVVGVRSFSGLYEGIYHSDEMFFSLSCLNTVVANIRSVHFF